MTKQLQTLSCNQILSHCAKAVWQKLANEGESPIPTPDDLSNPDWWNFPGNHNAREIFSELHEQWQKHGKEAIDIHIELSEQDRKDLVNLNPDFTQEQIKAIAEKQIPAADTLRQKSRDFFILISSFVQAFNLRDISERIETIHKIWLIARETNQQLKHPLAPIVRAWLQEQTAKHITPEYDHKHPAAVLKHPMGSIREVNFVTGERAQLREFATPQRITQTESLQLRLNFANDPPSILPGLMPLEVAHPMGLQATTKKGAVSHVVRVFFEALMALEPNQRQADLMFTLNDLINYLYPDGKFNRTLQLPYIIKALDILHFYATVPFKEDDKGNIGDWRPVVVRTRLRPDDPNDKKIFLDVKLPPDATQGMIVEKAIMRLLGKQSAPKFNAYLTACWLWDKYGTVKGKLIDPTRPVEQRNDTGLVDPTGKSIVTPSGKPITNVYHPRAVSQLQREPNPAAERYPILSDEDLILACFPNGYNPKYRGRDLERAKAHWTALETDGIISIHKDRDGWRIMPSERHLKTHRGIREAIKKGKR